jgi:hypothetical protein
MYVRIVDQLIVRQWAVLIPVSLKMIVNLYEVEERMKPGRE